MQVHLILTCLLGIKFRKVYKVNSHQHDSVPFLLWRGALNSNAKVENMISMVYNVEKAKDDFWLNKAFFKFYFPIINLLFLCKSSLLLIRILKIFYFFSLIKLVKNEPLVIYYLKVLNEFHPLLSFFNLLLKNGFQFSTLPNL